MNLEGLFNQIDGDVSHDLMGELIFDEDRIIWTYDINKNIDITDDDGISEEEVEIISIEEKLQEAHFHDIGLIQNNISLLENRENWYFTEPILNHSTILSEFFLIVD